MIGQILTLCTITKNKNQLTQDINQSYENTNQKRTNRHGG